MKVFCFSYSRRGLLILNAEESETGFPARYHHLKPRSRNYLLNELPGVAASIITQLQHNYELKAHYPVALNEYFAVKETDALRALLFITKEIGKTMDSEKLPEGGDNDAGEE